jgi:hypothetical protein
MEFDSPNNKSDQCERWNHQHRDGHATGENRSRLGLGSHLPPVVGDYAAAVNSVDARMGLRAGRFIEDFARSHENFSREDAS